MRSNEYRLAVQNAFLAIGCTILIVAYPLNVAEFHKISSEEISELSANYISNLYPEPCQAGFHILLYCILRVYVKYICKQGK